MINRLGILFLYTKVRAHGGISRFISKAKNVIKKPPRQPRFTDHKPMRASIQNGKCDQRPDGLSGI